MRQLICSVSACLFCFSSAVLADTAMKTDISVDPVQAAGSADTTMTYIKGNMVRMDTGISGAYMLYDNAAHTMTIVNPAEHSYTVMDEAALQAMGSQVAKARQRMQAMLAEMPPEQRRQMEQIIGNQLGAIMGMDEEPQSEPEVRRTGEAKTVNGFSCQVYTVSGPDGGSYCMASIEELGIPESDYQTFRDMTAFTASMAKQVAGAVGVESAAGQVRAMMEIDGIPIMSHTPIANGHGKSVLTSVSTRTLDASLFTLPKGYTQQQIPSMGEH